MGNGNFDDLVVRVPDWLLHETRSNKIEFPVWVLHSVGMLSSRAFRLLVYITTSVGGIAGRYKFILLKDMVYFTNSSKQTTSDALGDLLEIGAVLRRRSGRYYEYTIRRV